MPRRDAPAAGDRISRIIRELVREWGRPPYDINNGPCEEFALEVMDRSGVSYGPPAWEIYEDSTDGVALPGHVWISHGGRSYDAEAPDGVDDWRDLPLFRRIRGLPGYKRTLDLNCKSDADLDAIGEGEAPAPAATAYHAASRLLGAAEPRPEPANDPEEAMECPKCGGESMTFGDEALCLDCGAEFAAVGAPPAVWEPPPRLYHGTSLGRFREMLARPESFELYLASAPEGTEMYAQEASNEDDTPQVTVAFDTAALESSGLLMPDWDDVGSMISGGETDADGEPLFGDARFAQDVPWRESLRLIGTCSYEGPLSGAIAEADVDGEVHRPPFAELAGGAGSGDPRRPRGGTFPRSGTFVGLAGESTARRASCGAAGSRGAWPPGRRACT